MKIVSGRNGHPARWITVAAAIAASVALTAACGSSGSSQSSSTGQSGGASQTSGTSQTSSTGGVALHPASGLVNSKPTWATTTACPAGYQGSGLFTEVNTDGSWTSISQVVDGTAAPFGGPLQASLTELKSLASIPNGGTDELFMICASQQGATGKTQDVMKIYITYSADGTRYTTSATH